MKNQDYRKLTLDYLCVLEGVKTNLKNLHWSAKHLTLHNLIGELLSSVDDNQDEIAEISQGYLKEQFKPNELTGKKCSCECVCDTLSLVISSTNSFHQAIDSDITLAGVVNCINDFQQKLLKYRYLFMLAVKDGASNTVSVKK